MSAASLAIREQAADWVVRLDEAPADPALQRDCAEWAARDVRHARALEEMRRLWGAIGADTPVPRPAVRSGRRRIAAVGSLALVLLVAGASWRLLPWRAWTAQERTASGEVRQLTLADGSRVTLNGGTAVDIDLTGDARRVRLHRGEVYVEVAPGGKPFVVIDRDGGVRAMGTRYAVRRDDHDTLVTVTESRVQVRPSAALDQPVEVAAGRQLRFDRQGVTAPMADAPPQALAWREGRLVFEDAPLAEVLRELGRYRPGLLWADESALDGLRFTGVLPTAQGDQALALLAAALPIEVRHATPWVVHVGRRSGAATPGGLASR